MADRVTKEVRSKIMKSVGTRNTGAELALRKALHARGFRYRINDRNLPGKPDLVFPSKKKVIFVHGCFWHGHSCKYGGLPKTNLDYWSLKIQKNQDRDDRQKVILESLGWQVKIIWECQIKREFGSAIKEATNFLEQK